MNALRAAIVVSTALVALACDVDHRYYPTTGPSPIVQNPQTPIVVDNVVEFRVTGVHPTALVQIQNPFDGLSQIDAVLPYSQEINLAGRDSAFLSLSARGSSFGFLHVGIFVNGIVFREASSSSIFVNPVVTVAGTWRRAR